MSSGLAKTKSWVLEFIQETTSEIDPLMGCTSSGDTQSQVTLKFGSKQAAIDYAREHGIDAQIFEPKQRKFNVRSGGYKALSEFFVFLEKATLQHWMACLKAT